MQDFLETCNGTYKAYTMNYARSLRLTVTWYIVALSKVFRFVSLALGQSLDCSSASEASPRNIAK